MSYLVEFDERSYVTAVMVVVPALHERLQDNPIRIFDPRQQYLRPVLPVVKRVFLALLGE
jgi:hypothetical protein